MRPKPSELIAGVRAVLKDTVLPDLGSEHARTRVVEIRALLAQVDWDDAGFGLVRRNAALADALRECEAWRRADEQRTAAWPPCSVNEVAEETLDGHLERYEDLAASAAAVVEALGEWIAEHPGDAEARQVLRAMARALAG